MIQTILLKSDALDSNEEAPILIKEPINIDVGKLETIIIIIIDEIISISTFHSNISGDIFNICTYKTTASSQFHTTNDLLHSIKWMRNHYILCGFDE